MQQATRFGTLEETLKHYRDITLSTLLGALPSKEPREYLYDLLPEYPGRPGKGLRSALCIATCNAFGGNTESVLNTAATIELFHNAFLINDDIQDGSEFRRGDPTLHSTHGIGLAVNVSNAINLSCLRLLMDNRRILGPSLTWKIMDETENMLRQSLEGQSMELGWIRDNKCDLDQDDYFRMTLKKTAWYTCMYPCRVGALVAASGTVDLNRFYNFGAYLGAAFQIQDDILNLSGDYEKYGKEIYGDIWEGKRTLMLIHLLNNCSRKEKALLVQFLEKPRQDRNVDEVMMIRELMNGHECIVYARKAARYFAGAALQEYSVAFGDLPDTDEKAFLLDIVMYMIERDY